MLKNRSTHNANCNQCAANFLCLPKGLEPSEIDEINALITNYREVSKGEHVYFAQDPLDHLYAVYSGSCKDSWVNENGDERIDNFYLPGDIIGLESIPNRKHFFSLIALEDSKLCLIPLDALFELMQKHDSILKRVMHIASYKMQNDQHVSITTNANQRLADFILNIIYRLEERQKYTDHISLPMSQLDISLFLGMAHETVNRILKKLQEDSIIRIDNKKIYVVDLESLRKLTTPLMSFGQV